MEELKKECSDNQHNFQPISWERNFWGDKVARHLACSKCGKVVSTGLKMVSGAEEAL